MSTFPQFNYFKHRTLPKKRSINQHQRFNFLFLLAAFSPVFLVGSFNYAIDPYDVFNTPNFFGMNHEKPKKDNNDRLYKATDVIRIKPEIIFLGSSRTKQGLNPNHPALSNRKSVYNLALNGPNVYEIRRYLEHAIATNPNLKEVIFGVDFFMFNANLKNQPTFTENRLEKSYIDVQDLLKSLFSLDAFTASQETIQASFKKENTNDQYGENGFMPNRNVVEKKDETQWRFEQGINLYFQLHSNYEFSQEYLEDFKKIVQICRENNISLKIFISPSHSTDLEAIWTTGRWQQLENWKRELVKITPVWDFYYYNSITTESLSNNMQNYADNSHYTPPIGNLVLNRILGEQENEIPQDFGLLLTPDNIEIHLTKINADRQNWLKKHPDEAKLVANIYAKLIAQKK